MKELPQGDGTCLCVDSDCLCDDKCKCYDSEPCTADNHHCLCNGGGTLKGGLGRCYFRSIKYINKCRATVHKCICLPSELPNWIAEKVDASNCRVHGTTTQKGWCVIKVN